MSENTPEVDVEAIRARLDAATPGPWRYGRKLAVAKANEDKACDLCGTGRLVKKSREEYESGYWHHHETTLPNPSVLVAGDVLDPTSVVCDDQLAWEDAGVAREADAELIINAPADIRRLLDQNARLSAELAEVRSAASRLHRALRAIAARIEGKRDALAANVDAVRALPPEPRCDHEGDCSEWSHGWDSGRNATLAEVGRVIDGQPTLRDYSGSPHGAAQEPAPGPETPDTHSGEGTGVPGPEVSDQASGWVAYEAHCAECAAKTRDAHEGPDVEGWAVTTVNGGVGVCHETEFRPMLTGEAIPVGAVLAFIADQPPLPVPSRGKGADER